MSFEFELPELGEDIETGDVVNIMISEGDKVSKDQPLMEIETDKAVIELPSPVDGKVESIKVNTGDTIKVGQLLITFENNSDKQVNTKSDKQEKATSHKSEDIDIPKSNTDNAEPDSDNKQESKVEKHVESSVIDKKTKEKEGVSEKKSATADEIDEAKVITINTRDRTNITESYKQYIPASPSIRRLAREIGVDISKVTGTGPGGRITDEDVKHYSQNKLSEIEQDADIQTPDKLKYRPSGDDRSITEDMSKVRILTAERLTYSWKAPHVTQHDKADITEVEEYRKTYGNKLKASGVKLTMTSILTKITSHALKKFPKFNCSIDMDEEIIIYKNFINIGIAVDTERGLLVPVIKDADKKDIIQISQDISDLSERSRNKKIKVEELQDSTFTISNLGGIGGTYFTPVINSPNVAILGVSRSVTQPVYIDNEFRPRLMLPLSLSYDHRIIDGADAARFTSWIVDALENPFSVLMNS